MTTETMPGDTPATSPNFTRILNPGRTPDGSLFVKIEYTHPRLSLSGVVAPMANGDARGGCGQVLDELDRLTSYTHDWSPALARRLKELWERWHLNDLRAGCEHQRSDPAHDTKKPVTLQPYSWSPQFHDWRRRAEEGKLSPEDYATFRNIVPTVRALTIDYRRPKYPTPEAVEALIRGWIKPDKPEMKTAGWVDYREHPDGLLSKPCPVCGYQYGSKWLLEEVPEEVLGELRNLPETTVKPAWV